VVCAAFKSSLCRCHDVRYSAMTGPVADPGPSSLNLANQSPGAGLKSVGEHSCPPSLEKWSRFRRARALQEDSLPGPLSFFGTGPEIVSLGGVRMNTPEKAISLWNLVRSHCSGDWTRCIADPKKARAGQRRIAGQLPKSPFRCVTARAGQHQAVPEAAFCSSPRPPNP